MKENRPSTPSLLARPSLSLAASRRVRLLVLLSLIIISCGDDVGGAPDARPQDAEAEAALPMRPAWPRAFPDSDTFGVRRGLRVARSIIHLHSPLSHDACDGEGYVDGELLDPECLQHLRDGICALRLDAVMLTDHAPHVEEASFEGLLWVADGDELVRNEAGDPVANSMRCPDGHRVLMMAGSENDLMPLALERHVIETEDPEALRAAYDANGPEAVAAFREAGAIGWIAHTESKDLESLRTLGLDGLEIYNLHANIDPDIREEHLGLPGLSFAGDLLRFADSRGGLEPDFAILSFLSPNDNALNKWDTLLAEGIRIAGSAGTDAHENALPGLLSDGERGDSYRRMMRWFSNYLLVPERSLPEIKSAVRRGRMYVSFDIFGFPMGFDFFAEHAGETFEMSDEAPVGATLRVARPELPESFPAEPAPVIEVRLLRAEAGGAVEVASSSEGDVEHIVTSPGVYRAEVRITPHHVGPYLGDLAERLVRQLPWVYANPIYIVERAEPSAPGA